MFVLRCSTGVSALQEKGLSEPDLFKMLTEMDFFLYSGLAGLFAVSAI